MLNDCEFGSVKCHLLRNGILRGKGSLNFVKWRIGWTDLKGFKSSRVGFFLFFFFPFEKLKNFDKDSDRVKCNFF